MCNNYDDSTEVGHFIYCDEGLCKDPTLGFFRRTYPFGPDYAHDISHVININYPRSAEDKLLEKKKHLFEGKAGVCGFFWSSPYPNNIAPICGTIFPLTPVVNGKCLWATARHTGSLLPAVGSVLSPAATLETSRTIDRFGLQKVSQDAPMRHMFCPKTLERVDMREYDGCPEFAIMESTLPSHVDPKHFWIPDPTPLAEGKPIALFGSPGGSPSASQWECAAHAARVFIYNHKSVSTGSVVSSSESLVCHDASTNSGFCGAVGVSLNDCEGDTFSFLHVGTYGNGNGASAKTKLFGGIDPAKAHNHALSVNDPDFKAAYIRHVVPVLQAARETLTERQIATIKKYTGDF